MRLKEYVDTFNINKSEFARQLGIHTTTLYNYIEGKRIPPLDVAVKIVRLTEGLVTYPELAGMSPYSEDLL